MPQKCMRKNHCFYKQPILLYQFSEARQVLMFEGLVLKNEFDDFFAGIGLAYVG